MCDGMTSVILSISTHPTLRKVLSPSKKKQLEISIRKDSIYVADIAPVLTYRQMSVRLQHYLIGGA